MIISTNAEKAFDKIQHHFMIKHFKTRNRDFAGGPAVKNPPSNAGDAGSIPSQGTNMPHAVGKLSPCTTTTELEPLN